MSKNKVKEIVFLMLHVFQVDYKYENIELIYSNLRTITNDNKNQIKVDNHLNSDDLNFYPHHEKF